MARAAATFDPAPTAGTPTAVSAAIAHSAPLSAFVIGERDASTSGKWQTIFVDACLGHHSAWQPGAQWSQQLG